MHVRELDLMATVEKFLRPLPARDLDVGDERQHDEILINLHHNVE